MRLGVLGGAGQVGIELVELARAERVDVAAPLRGEVDITERRAVDRWVNDGHFDAIVNCAAYTAVDAAEEAPHLAYAVNREGPCVLGVASARANVPVIHLSTDFVFDGEKATPYAESDVPHPLNVYGASKLAGEEAILTECRDGIVLRVSWVFSAHRNNFVKAIVNRAATGDALEVVDDQVGGPCGAAGVARVALSLAGRAKGVGGRLYHFEAGPFVSRYEFATFIVDEARRLGVIETSPRITPTSTARGVGLARRPLNSRLIGSLLKRDFDVPVHDWRSELRQTLSALARDPVYTPRSTKGAHP